MNLLNKLNYDIIKYEFSDIRSKSIIELLNNKSISYKNVTSFFSKKEVKMVIVIDEIDSLNNTDKSCINSLIKLVRLSNGFFVSINFLELVISFTKLSLFLHCQIRSGLIPITEYLPF